MERSQGGKIRAWGLNWWQWKNNWNSNRFLESRFIRKPETFPSRGLENDCAACSHLICRCAEQRRLEAHKICVCDYTAFPFMSGFFLFYLSRHHEVICLTAGWANENQAGLILLPPHATDSLCLIQTPLYVHITNMRSAVGYEPACGLSRNLWDIKEQFLLCATELTPQNTRPHGTDAVQTRPPQWKVGPPLRENTSTFLLPRVPASAINYKTTVRETVWSLSLHLQHCAVCFLVAQLLSDWTSYFCILTHCLWNHMSWNSKVWHVIKQC